jgi:transposase
MVTEAAYKVAWRPVQKPPRGLFTWQGVNPGCLDNGTQGMEAPIIDDELWTLIKPLLPSPRPRRKEHPGRPRVSDRAALNGILFVLKTGLRWNYLPTVSGFGSGATCWRRLNDWCKAGVWDRLHELLPDKLREAGQIDLSYAAVDSSSVRAVGAGEKLARTPRIARDPVRNTTSS